MLTWNNLLFYVAFLGQIFLISYYIPGKILKRLQYVHEHFPPEQYPKLYPQSIEKYVIGQRVFKIANWVIVLIGFAILLAVIFVVDHSTFADDGYISEFWPMVYGAIQFLPAIFLELSAFGQLKLMRKANTSTTRTAQLRPRRLFDFMSPQLFGLTIVMYLAAIVVDLYVHEFAVTWTHDTVQRGIVLSATNLLLVALGAWLMYGQRLNPHQSIEDRSTQVRASLGSFLYISIAMSVFFMVQALDDVYDMDFLGATLLSVYYKVIVAISMVLPLRSQCLENMNFDVYKEKV